jgi:hypothetical protein
MTEPVTEPVETGLIKTVNVEMAVPLRETSTFGVLRLFEAMDIIAFFRPEVKGLKVICI